jgi:hypothetical protein
MGRELADLFERSLVYQCLSQVRVWARHSTLVSLVGDERLLISGAALFLSLSLVRVLTSTMGAPVKFLSFALLFVVVTALTWNYTDPGTDA